MTLQKVYYPLLHVEEIIPILNKIAVFGGLSDTQLYEVFRLLKQVTYEEGEFVYRQGDAPSHIYIVQKGEIRIVMDEKDTSLELMDFSTGDCFGETSVIGIQEHDSSAVAVARTELIVLERGALLSIFETDKELFGRLILNIARETARRLHKMDAAFVQYLLRAKK